MTDIDELEALFRKLGIGCARHERGMEREQLAFETYDAKVVGHVLISASFEFRNGKFLHVALRKEE